MCLCDLRVGESGRVVRVLAGENIRRRLFDIGITQGTLVKCCYKSIFNGMKAYLIRDSLIAIRDIDASGVEVI